MCDSIQFNISDISKSQIDHHQLEDFTTSDDLVTFRQKGKPGVIPVLLHGQLNLYRWAGTYSVSLLPEGVRRQRVLIPAAFATQNGIRYKVAPASICGFLVRERRGTVAYMLVQTASDYYERMTHHEWEPVFDREIKYEL